MTTRRVSVHVHGSENGSKEGHNTVMTFKDVVNIYWPSRAMKKISYMLIESIELIQQPAEKEI